MTAKELLMRVPDAVKGDPSTPDAVIQFETTEPVHCIVKDGTVTSVEGAAQQADVTVKVKDDDLVRMFDGKLNPMTAFMTGRLKVRGDIGLAQRLIKSIDRDKLSAG